MPRHVTLESEIFKVYPQLWNLVWLELNKVNLSMRLHLILFFDLDVEERSLSEVGSSLSPYSPLPYVETIVSLWMKQK